MSFRVDLWNGLNAIKTQFTSTFNKMSNICDILLYYANYQKAYSKNLESLYKDKKDSIKDDYLIDKIIFELINNFKLESEYHREHYKFIKKKIIVSIKEIIEKGKVSFNNIFNEGIQIQENFSKIKMNLINKQKAYNNSLKDFYNFISNFDENEMKYILENENKPNDNLNSNTDNNINRNIALSQSEIKISNTITIDNKLNKQQIAKKEKLVDKISETKNEYNTAINESNEYLKVYRNGFENVLQSLEEKYKLLIETLHSSLISTMEQRIELLNKLSLLYNNFLENNVKKIKIKNEIIEFIIRNVTKEFPINKFEFTSIKFDNKKINLDINKYVKDNIESEGAMGQRRGKSRKKTEVRNFRRRSIKKKNTGDKNENSALLLENNAISTDIKNYKIKSNIYLIDDFVDELITNRGEEEKINLDNIYYNDSSSKMIDISNIKSLIDKKNNECLIYVENLIKSINNKRAKGNFVLNEKSYVAFIDLFKYLLDNYPTSDFVLKNIIILSQTFYTFDIDKNDQTISTHDKKKIFLQNGLKNNPIFNKNETWHRVINFTLSNNVINKDISQSNDKNDIYNKLKVLSYNTLISYLTDLKYFTDDENIFNEIKNFYIRIYQLDEESINKEVKDIVNYEPVKQRKKGVSFSLKCIQKTNSNSKKQGSFNENKEN